MKKQQQCQHPTSGALQICQACCLQAHRAIAAVHWLGLIAWRSTHSVCAAATAYSERLPQSGSKSVSHQSGSHFAAASTARGSGLDGSLICAQKHQPTLPMLTDACLQDTSLWSRTPSAVRKAPIPHQAYYCLLGHLYAAARLELMRMGQTLNLSEYTPAGPAHGNVSLHTALLLVLPIPDCAVTRSHTTAVLDCCKHAQLHCRPMLCTPAHGCRHDRLLLQPCSSVQRYVHQRQKLQQATYAALQALSCSCAWATDVSASASLRMMVLHAGRFSNGVSSVQPACVAQLHACPCLHWHAGSP